jgi:hypothetical protein
VRVKRLLLAAFVLAALVGCKISRNIVDLKPVRQPPLTELERNLTYTDPDDGRPDYVLTR